MNDLPIYFFDEKTGFDDLERFIPDGDEIEFAGAVVASGLFDGVNPAILIGFGDAKALVLRDDPGAFKSNRSGDDFELDEGAA